jgi:hypothetical protein
MGKYGALRYPAFMSEKQNAAEQRSEAGLCANCLHARRIESARGSGFFLCELSLTDPRFAKYPRLPVLSCSGYTAKEKHAPS